MMVNIFQRKEYLLLGEVFILNLLYGGRKMAATRGIP